MDKSCFQVQEKVSDLGYEPIGCKKSLMENSRNAPVGKIIVTPDGEKIISGSEFKAGSNDQPINPGPVNWRKYFYFSKWISMGWNGIS